MRPLRVETTEVLADDGARLAVHASGHGAPIVLANGLAGDHRAFLPQMEFFGDRYRLVSWDYRGLYHSAAARQDDATVERHARDAIAAIDATGEDRVCVIGWSFGVQVALEVFRRSPDRVASLVLINGSASRTSPLQRASSFTADAFSFLKRVGARVPRRMRASAKRVATYPETLAWAKRLGLVCGAPDDDLLLELASSFTELDFDVYFQLIGAMRDHDATDVLAEVDVPTLVVAGDRDPFTRRDGVEVLAQEIAGAELLMVPGGSHFLHLEFPELVNLRIEKFFRERGYPPVPPPLG